MDVLYIPQLDEIDASGEASGGGSAARYRLLKRTPEDGTVLLTDRAVTRVELTTSDPARLVLPPLVKGQVRDFFARLVITSEEPPEITFAAPSGETVSFEDADEDVFSCEIGVNIFAFTETDEGIFIVNRKQMDIDVVVEFDACGGTLDKAKESYKLGAQYAALPVPTMTGMVFQGWYTQPHDGIRIGDSDRCKTEVTKLYAQWKEYVDPFVDAICPSHNLTFFTSGDLDWFVDEDGAARSGAIGDNQASMLSTTVVGPGTLSLRAKVSSEQGYDRLELLVDGASVADLSGEYDWQEFSQEIPAGSHELVARYSKDGSVSNGSDCGWIDDVVWTPTGGE
ncbi:MAG: InlB B-repeat-containing protein [Kiritimatiellia bacterium]